MDPNFWLVVLSIFLKKVGGKSTDLVVETCAKKALSLTVDQSKNLKKLWARFPVARRHEFQEVKNKLEMRLPPGSLGRMEDVKAVNVSDLVEQIKTLVQDPEVIAAIDALTLDDVDAVIEIAQSQCRFVYGPAVSPSNFYGRSRLIREVRGRIGGVNPQCVNVVGMRRAGKSSLLRLIGEDSEQFFDGNCQPLVVSLDLTNACFHSPAGVQEGVRREIATKVGRSPWAENAGDDPFVFEDGLRGLRDQGWRLVVLLDEFEGIKQHLEAFQGWGEDWRAKASAELLTLVVVGQRPIGEIYGSLGLTSPFGNIFSQSIVGPLAAADWQQLVRDRRPETTAEEMDWIGRVSGGWAFYVQMAGAMLWECGDMAAAEGEFLFQARSHFGQLWKALKDKERSAMRGESARRGTLDLLRRFGLLRADGQPFSSLFFEVIEELED